MDPKNLHPDLKARLDNVMNTPTSVPPPPTTVAPMGMPPVVDKEAILAQEQDANSLRMPPSAAPKASLPPSPPPPRPIEKSIDVQDVPKVTSVAAGTQVQSSEPKKKNVMLPFFIFGGAIIFFAAYTVIWVMIFMPQIFGGGK